MKWKQFGLPTIALAATVVFAACAAKANTITTFDVFGLTSLASSYSGTVTIDVTAGNVTAADIAVSTFAEFNIPQDLGFVLSGTAAVLNIGNGSEVFVLTFFTDTPNTLI